MVLSQPTILAIPGISVQHVAPEVRTRQRAPEIGYHQALLVRSQAIPVRPLLEAPPAVVGFGLVLGRLVQAKRQTGFPPSPEPHRRRCQWTVETCWENCRWDASATAPLSRFLSVQYN